MRFASLAVRATMLAGLVLLAVWTRAFTRWPSGRRVRPLFTRGATLHTVV